MKRVFILFIVVSLHSPGTADFLQEYLSTLKEVYNKAGVYLSNYEAIKGEVNLIIEPIQDSILDIVDGLADLRKEVFRAITEVTNLGSSVPRSRRSLNQDQEKEPLESIRKRSDRLLEDFQNRLQQLWSRIETDGSASKRIKSDALSVGALKQSKERVKPESEAQPSSFEPSGGDTKFTSTAPLPVIKSTPVLDATSTAPSLSQRCSIENLQENCSDGLVEVSPHSSTTTKAVDTIATTRPFGESTVTDENSFDTGMTVSTVTVENRSAESSLVTTLEYNRKETTITEPLWRKEDRAETDEKQGEADAVKKGRWGVGEDAESTLTVDPEERNTYSHNDTKADVEDVERRDRTGNDGQKGSEGRNEERKDKESREEVKKHEGKNNERKEEDDKSKEEQKDDEKDAREKDDDRREKDVREKDDGRREKGVREEDDRREEKAGDDDSRNEQSNEDKYKRKNTEKDKAVEGKRKEKTKNQQKKYGFKSYKKGNRKSKCPFHENDDDGEHDWKKKFRVQIRKIGLWGCDINEPKTHYSKKFGGNRNEEKRKSRRFGSPVRTSDQVLFGDEEKLTSGKKSEMVLDKTGFVFGFDFGDVFGSHEDSKYGHQHLSHESSSPKWTLEKGVLENSLPTESVDIVLALVDKVPLPSGMDDSDFWKKEKAIEDEEDTFRSRFERPSGRRGAADRKRQSSWFFDLL